MTRKEILLALAIVVLAALGGGLYYWLQSRSAREAPALAPEAGGHVTAPAPAPEVQERIQNPIPAPPGVVANAPTLESSDAPVLSGLRQIFGAPAVAQYVIPQSLIRHIVATVDNLPRKKAPVQTWPVKPMGGKPLTSGSEDALILSAESYQRYEPLVHALQNADMKQLAALYTSLYPLFQQAYEDLGYPGKYFNDRLVAVIDDLLATPETSAPISLQQPNVLYQYKDPALEDLSAGQKTLLRMGPSNERSIKQKLRELRAAVATGSR